MTKPLKNPDTGNEISNPHTNENPDLIQKTDTTPKQENGEHVPSNDLQNNKNLDNKTENLPDSGNEGSKPQTNKNFVSIQGEKKIISKHFGLYNNKDFRSLMI